MGVGLVLKVWVLKTSTVGWRFRFALTVVKATCLFDLVALSSGQLGALLVVVVGGSRATFNSGGCYLRLGESAWLLLAG